MDPGLSKGKGEPIRGGGPRAEPPVQRGAIDGVRGKAPEVEVCLRERSKGG